MHTFRGKHSGAAYKDLFNQKIRYNDKYVVGALKDVPLSKVSWKDIDIFMYRMQDKPVAANNTLSALSVAFEWDITQATNQVKIK